MQTNEMPMLDQNLHKNLLYSTFVLLPMIEQNTMIIDTEVELPHETTLTTKTIHTTDTFLHLEIDLVMTKALLLHSTLEHDMIRLNVTPDLIALHTDPHTDFRIDTTLALDIDHAPIPEITSSQKIQIHTDHLQDQETLDFLDLVHTPIPETKLIWYNNKNL